MSKSYEFSHQSLKQKVILGTTKLFVMLLLAQAIYSLGWQLDGFIEKLDAAGRILICFWAYSNLLRVKVEIQELFIPPFIIREGVEFLVIGGTFSTIYLFWMMWNIILLS